MKWGDIKRKVDQDGQPYLEFSERITKTRPTGKNARAFLPKLWPNTEHPERCPLFLLQEYERHRPYDKLNDEDDFYLGINHRRHPNAVCWYQRQPMGKTKLGQVMGRLTHVAGIPGRFTNHSTRRTSINTLMQASVPPVIVAQLSGHKNIQSLAHYSTASTAQQKAMFNIVNRNIVPGQNALPSASTGSRSALPEVSPNFIKTCLNSV